jgi:phosphoglycolate phosphatase-like HAD superfamily hydrolase
MASEDPQLKLKQFKPTKRFFVGIDSDGCAFNSMEVKHNDCFSVALVREYHLAAVSRQVHEAWDFVNLYSQNRGCNRFKAILFVLDHLREMPRVKLAGVKVPELAATRAWVKSDSNLSNARLKEVAAAATGPEKEELDELMVWSKLVNKFVEETVHNLPPFPGLRAALPKLNEQADVLVVSATPAEALVRRVLMIGDAPGDLKAARDVGALFYPINPGAEEKSWERFVNEGIGKFFSMSYAGAYEASLIAEFMKLLPHNPPWQIA